MGEKSIKSPNIRFVEFTDDWEHRKLEEMLEERNEQIPENDEYPLMSFVQGIGVSPKGDRYDRSFLVKEDKKKYKKTELGDFIYSSNNLETGSIGFNRTGKAVISPVYSIFSSKSESESRFIGIISKRKDFIAKMVRFRQGVVYGQWRIHEKDFLDIKITVPKYEEQNMIIKFFDDLDNLIRLNQRKLELLNETKKNMLQKMFPKDGKNIPEIRFEGFTDEWEQRKLSDIAEIVSGGTPSTTNAEYWDGDIDWYAPAEINNQIYLDSSERKITELGLKKSSAKKLPAEKTVLFTSRASIGKMAILRKQGTTNQGFQSIVLCDKTNPYFVYSMGSIIKEKADKVASGSTFPEISGKTLGNLKFMFASKDEQDKIGEYFSALDSLITLQQRELDLLENLKKSMLQKMFI